MPSSVLNSTQKEVEVFLNEIYLALLSQKNAPITQKLHFVTILNRLCADPRALVEIYLNYDCDQTVDNIYQTIVEDLSRFSTATISTTTINEQAYEEARAKTQAASEWQLKSILPPPLTVAHIIPAPEPETDYPKEYVVKRLALEALVEALKSLVNWSASLRSEVGGSRPAEGENKLSTDELRASIDPTASETTSRMETPLPPSTPEIGRAHV